ncbi:ferritin family protein [Pyrococcus abyssi]|uniref:Rubrerythrin-related protein, fused to C-terminal DUF835 domain n=1 Tax=Pyrococcus abyssi (strain GE5 / Orsay) TaxID=272844 RepID=Q9UZU3_PYRAB|nr:ferritin family protein [Pyrococcus abyssi]CAB49963.1 Hypothetical protein PAB1671 [Pyrococcus abyssi GE5]CCE70463.1 TPA: Rubrerythrin-related protein, fused to C-terminal DUF835 domain [Pyrococcus abyssi GE5]
MAELKLEAREYMEKIVKKLKDLSPKEILSYAIFNEEAEIRYYRELAKRSERESVRVLFLQMADESQEHHDRLYKLFKELYPNEEPVEVDAPPVEVAPFYPKFETVDDYLEALEYCMESELFAKETYEVLALKATNEDARVLFAQLAEMENDHYLRLKKLYNLLTSFKQKKILPEDLEPGGYLLSDRTKARYLFLDMLSKSKEAYLFTRENPEKVKEWLKRDDINIIWVTNLPGKGRISPRMLIEPESVLCEILKAGNVVVLLENLEILVLITDFRKLFECISRLRDIAISSGSYLIVHAKKEAVGEREWALLESELAPIE